MRSENRPQLELLPNRSEPHVEPVTPELIRAVRRKSTFAEAWRFAQDHADLDDKQCYDPLRMDASHWSKIRKGQAWPPADARYGQYMDVVRNEIPLIWLVESRGYDFLTVRKHMDDSQRRIAELERKVADQDRTIRLLVDARRS
jgi:hypothetical protein